MAFNATSGDMDWPTRLIWSKELEVQLLLSDIPLIAVGVLGIGAITLLMLVKRLSRDASLLTAATACGFAAGFFDLLGLIQAEDVNSTIDSLGSQSLLILSELFQSWLTSASLFFVYHRTLECFAGPPKEPAERSGSYFDDDNRDDRFRQRVMELGSKKIVRYIVYFFLTAQGGLDISWRHLLLHDRNAMFEPFFLTSNAMQLAYLVVADVIILVEIVMERGKKKSGIRYMPLLAGIICATSICITGFLILAFTITPLARLITASQMYIWLLDSLVYSFRYRPPDADTPLSKERTVISAVSSRPPTLPEKEETQFVITSPMQGFMFNAADSTVAREEQRSSEVSNRQVRVSQESGPQLRQTARESFSQHRRSLSLGPIIRRGSRLPSWLYGNTRALSPNGSESGILKEDETRSSQPGQFDTEQDVTEEDTLGPMLSQQAGPDGNKVWSQIKSRRPAPSSIYSYTSERAGKTSGPPGRGRAASVSSTTGTYNERGYRLDSPIDNPMAFGSPVTRSPQALPRGSVPPPPVPAVASSPTRSEIRFSSIGSGIAAARARYRVSERSSVKSSPGLPASLFSRQSDLSLSQFPRPPSTAGGSISSGAVNDIDEQRRHDNTPESLAELVSAPLAKDTDESSLKPPRMPIAAQESQLQHKHNLSWQSNDTFTGSTMDGAAVVRSRGVNVTSFIDDSACPDRPKEDGTATTVKIMRASSITRKSARLMNRHESIRKSTQSGKSSRSAESRFEDAGSVEQLGVSEPVPVLEVPNADKSFNALTRNNSTASARTVDSDFQPPFVYDNDFVPMPTFDMRRRDTTDEIIRGYYRA